MGVTGAGKSTFVSHLADTYVPVGSGLTACTQNVAVYRCKYSGPVNVWLVDTPGFDDTHRSDTDVLREIARWLTESFSSKVILNGMIYLHRITDIRMQGSAMKNLHMFKKLCGHDATKNVVLATTMWEMVSPEDGERREQELMRTSEFWGEMILRGAQVKRHQNTADSAWHLVEIFASRSSTRRKAILTIQEEMVMQRKPLSKTDAGLELENSLSEERKKWARELEQTRDEMREALEAKDKETLEALRETEAKMNQKIKDVERDREKLKIGMRKQYKAKISELQAALKKQTLSAPRNNDPGLVTEETYIKSKTGKFTLSIAGDRFYLCGPRYQVWRTGKPYIRNKSDEATTYVSLGMNGSWYRHYHKDDGSCFTSRSSNFKDEYPTLSEEIDQHKLYGCPRIVALGVNGQYLFAGETRTLWKLPSKILAIKKPTKIKQLWLGRNDAFVLVTEGGKIEYDLKGKYGNLNEYLGRVKSEWSPWKSVKALALDLEGNSFAIMYGRKDWRWHHPTSDVYERFLSENKWLR